VAVLMIMTKDFTDHFFSLVTITIIQYFADDDQLSLSQWSPSPGSSIMISGDVQYYKSVGCATPVATTFRLFRSFELGSVGSTF